MHDFFMPGNSPTGGTCPPTSPGTIAVRVLAVMAMLGLALASGCTRTKPYQRGTLAKPEMAPDGDAHREALRNHVLSTREGAVGGFGGGGGGCGCN